MRSVFAFQREFGVERDPSKEKLNALLSSRISTSDVSKEDMRRKMYHICASLAAKDANRYSCRMTVVFRGEEKGEMRC